MDAILILQSRIDVLEKLVDKLQGWVIALAIVTVLALGVCGFLYGVYSRYRKTHTWDFKEKLTEEQPAEEQEKKTYKVKKLKRLVIVKDEDDHDELHNYIKDKLSRYDERLEEIDRRYSQEVAMIKDNMRVETPLH